LSLFSCEGLSLSEPPRFPLSIVLDSMPDAVMILDGDIRVALANSSARELFAAEGRRLAGTHLQELLPDICFLGGGPLRRCASVGDEGMRACELPEGRYCRACEISLSADGDSPRVLELRMQRVALDPSGAHICVLRDVTERRMAERRLRSKQRELERILDAMPAGVWMLDRAGNCCFENLAARRIWAFASAQADVAGRRAWRVEKDGQRRPVTTLADLCGDGAAAPDRGAMEMLDIFGPGGNYKSLLISEKRLSPGDDGHDGDDDSNHLVVIQDMTDHTRLAKAARLQDELSLSVFNSSTIGICVSDTDGCILVANPTLCELVGYSEDELLRLTVRDITWPSDWTNACEARVDALLSGDQTRTAYEQRYRHRDGHPVWVVVDASLLSDPATGPTYVLGQVIPIDARKQAEGELAVRDAALDIAQRTARFGYWLWSPTERTFTCSGEAARLLGVASQTGGSPWALAGNVHCDDRGLLYSALNCLLRDEMMLDLDFRIAAPDGSVARVIHMRGETAQSDGAAPLYVGTITDITERKRVEEELRASQRDLRQLQICQEQRLEDERRRIALELHDDLGELLTGLKMGLSAIRLRHAGNPALLGEINGIKGLVDDSFRVVRRVASNIRPPALNVGLIPAVQWLGQEFESRNGIRCQVNIDLDEQIRLPDEIATPVFRVIQETLTNTARHASASCVSIQLSIDGGQLLVDVRDNGIGFNPEAPGCNKHYGLFSQRERISALGGTLRIVSAPARGTTTMFSVPLEEES